MEKIKKIILLSDIHLLDKNPVCRTDDLLTIQWDKLRYVFNYAKENNALILQAGDLFDKSRSWKTLYEFLCLYNEYKIPMGVVFGQHDQMYRLIDSSNNMSVLCATNKIIKLGVKPLHIEGIDIYGCSYGEDIPEIKDKKNKNILVIHKEIGKEGKNIGDLGIIDAGLFLRSYKFDLILCGDIHEQFIIKKRNLCIINTGCMLRKDVTLINHIPSFVCLDVDTFEISDFIEIPYEKDVISREHIDVDYNRKDLMDDFINGLNSTEFEGVDFKVNLDKYLKENKIEDEVIKIIYSMLEYVYESYN